MKINFNFRLGEREVSVDAVYARNGDVHGCGGSATCDIVRVIDENGVEMIPNHIEEDLLIERGVKIGTDLLM